MSEDQLRQDLTTSGSASRRARLAAAARPCRRQARLFVTDAARRRRLRHAGQPGGGLRPSPAPSRVADLRGDRRRQRRGVRAVRGIATESLASAASSAPSGRHRDQPPTASTDTTSFGGTGSSHGPRGRAGGGGVLHNPRHRTPRGLLVTDGAARRPRQAIQEGLRLLRSRRGHSSTGRATRGRPRRRSPTRWSSQHTRFATHRRPRAARDRQARRGHRQHRPGRRLARGIAIVNTPRSNAESVANCVIAALFALAKRLEGARPSPPAPCRRSAARCRPRWCRRG